MRRWHGLTWRGWALFVPACALLFCGVFWGTLKTAAVLDPPPPAITLSPAATTQPAPNLRASSPGKLHPSHRPAHHIRRPAVTPQQPRIPGVGSNSFGVTSVPPTHYRAPVPPPASTAPVTITPIPGPSTPAPLPDPPPDTQAPPPSLPPDTPTDTPTDTVLPQTATVDAPSTLPGVPGGGSGWVQGR
jgi:hypothetical protein